MRFSDSSVSAFTVLPSMGSSCTAAAAGRALVDASPPAAVAISLAACSGPSYIAVFGVSRPDVGGTTQSLCLARYCTHTCVASVHTAAVLQGFDAYAHHLPASNGLRCRLR